MDMMMYDGKNPTTGYCFHLPTVRDYLQKCHFKNMEDKMPTNKQYSESLDDDSHDSDEEDDVYENEIEEISSESTWNSDSEDETDRIIVGKTCLLSKS